MTTITQEGIYIGDRGENFKRLISSLLKRGGLREKYIRILTDRESMKQYASAFTSELVDEVNNYQVYEQMGDLTGNKFIVWYMYKRFPQLKCAEGVKVVARLRINYGAKQSFSDIAKGLGFWPYISATNDLRQRKMKPLLEDVFEAFLGVTESILDDRIRIGVGYALVYDILKAIFDDMEISLKYEDLYDAKTRLKELFDIYESDLGPLVYRESKTELITQSKVFRVEGGTYETRQNGTINKKRIIKGRYVHLGVGSAALKADAQQNAAKEALKFLNSQGWIKPVPYVYNKFNVNSIDEKKSTIEEIKKRWGEDVNMLVSTKEKSKYQNKYQSTPLAYYCRIRDIEGVRSCIKLNSDCTIKDTDGMTPFDLLFIGDKDIEIVQHIILILDIVCKKRQMKKGTYINYVKQYEEECGKEKGSFFYEFESTLNLE